ncbi:hypothetical protein K438DRAFT_958981 [Mycena galopus ATCC 62051]|nr:hypothetical protein K438DRAFT_958981 [Mycena galopus ATCC 62051]
MSCSSPMRVVEASGAGSTMAMRRGTGMLTWRAPAGGVRSLSIPYLGRSAGWKDGDAAREGQGRDGCSLRVGRWWRHRTRPPPPPANPTPTPPPSSNSKSTSSKADTNATTKSRGGGSKTSLFEKAHRYHLDVNPGRRSEEIQIMGVRLLGWSVQDEPRVALSAVDTSSSGHSHSLHHDGNDDPQAQESLPCLVFLVLGRGTRCLPRPRRRGSRFVSFRYPQLSHPLSRPRRPFTFFCERPGYPASLTFHIWNRLFMLFL